MRRAQSLNAGLEMFPFMAFFYGLICFLTTRFICVTGFVFIIIIIIIFLTVTPSVTYNYIANDHLLTVTYRVTYNYVAKHNMTYNTKLTIN